MHLASPSAPAAVTPPSDAVISPRDARALLEAGRCVLVDVREADEHARERIHGARLVPLSTLNPAKIAALGADRVIVHCKSGRRSADAAARCASLAASGIEVTSLSGGIEGWKAAGLETIVDSARPRMGVMQQTQATIGVAIVAGCALSALVNPWFLALPAFMGVGLVVAGTTGACPLAGAIARLPWNRSGSCSKPGSCGS